MKKDLLVIIALFALLINSANAQDYQIAAGLKFSYEYGPSLKYFIAKDQALEAQLGFRSHGFVLSGLWEQHQSLLNINGLKLYYGFGGHLGGVGDNTNPRYDHTIQIGADAVVGVDYVIPQSPIALSLDLNPRLELGRGPYFDLSPGLGIKYIFN